MLRRSRNNMLSPVEQTLVQQTLYSLQSEVQLEKNILFSLGETVDNRRSKYIRFHSQYFSNHDQDLFPFSLFSEALTLGNNECINGITYPFSATLLQFRDHLLNAYSSVSANRKSHEDRSGDGPSDSTPPVVHFSEAWQRFEKLFFEEKEEHAVSALMPLTGCILSLHPLLASEEKELMLSRPRLNHQKRLTLKCLEGFCKSVSRLAEAVVGTANRESNISPHLVILMASVNEQVAQQEAEQNTTVSADLITGTVPLEDTEKEVSDEYFESGAKAPMVTDSVLQSGHSSASSTAEAWGRQTYIAYAIELNISLSTIEQIAADWKSAQMAYQFTRAFAALRTFVWDCREKLEHLAPQLDQDEELANVVENFEKHYRRCKQRFLEPENLI